MKDKVTNQKSYTGMYLILVAVIVVAAILLVFSMTGKSNKSESSSGANGQSQQIVHKCEKCGSTSCRGVIGTIFPDNNVHYICDSCLDAMS